jgi:uncharacterized protein (TIGR02646 family)
MIFLVRPPLETCIPDASLRERYETWRLTKILDLHDNSQLITSRWDQFVKGTGSARDLGPLVLGAVDTWQHHKCAWCESVDPGTYDHVAPKTKFPDKMFDWDNLLASCSDCNNLRSHHDIGVEDLIVPTRDEPLQYFRWNAITGACVPDPASRRAMDTARALAMHRFQGERFHKLRIFRTYLAFVIDDDVKLEATLEHLRQELDPKRPYLCIIRSWLLHPPDEAARTLRDLAFAKAGVLGNWVRPWLHPHEPTPWLAAPA